MPPLNSIVSFWSLFVCTPALEFISCSTQHKGSMQEELLGTVGPHHLYHCSGSVRVRRRAPGCHVRSTSTCVLLLCSLSLSQQSSDGMQKVEGTTYASLRVMECIQEFRSTNGLTAASSFLNLEVFAQFLFNSKETEELVYLTKKAHVLPHKPNPNPAPCIPRANKTPPIACMVWRSNAPKGHRPFQICCRFSSIMSVC
jgi:hypothetical protein